MKKSFKLPTTRTDRRLWSIRNDNNDNWHCRIKTWTKGTLDYYLGKLAEAVDYDDQLTTNSSHIACSFLKTKLTKIKKKTFFLIFFNIFLSLPLSCNNQRKRRTERGDRKEWKRKEKRRGGSGENQSGTTETYIYQYIEGRNEKLVVSNLSPLPKKKCLSNGKLILSLSKHQNSVNTKKNFFLSYFFSPSFCSLVTANLKARLSSSFAKFFFTISSFIEKKYPFFYWITFPKFLPTSTELFKPIFTDGT